MASNHILTCMTRDQTCRCFVWMVSYLGLPSRRVVKPVPDVIPYNDQISEPTVQGSRQLVERECFYGLTMRRYTNAHTDGNSMRKRDDDFVTLELMSAVIKA